jgi:hypothetical protein
MKISKIHQRFVNRLRWYHISKQDSLTRPEIYLGPNWETLINFWLYLDNLTEEQLRVVKQRYMALSGEERAIASGRAWRGAKFTKTHVFIVGFAAYNGVSYARDVVTSATYELIGIEKLLEQDYQPVFFPLFLNP